jgi:hypothetical protein
LHVGCADTEREAMDNVTYKLEGYDERYRCYFVREYINGSPTYLFKCYIKGNKATLYPHMPLNTTVRKRDKKEISIFDLKGG